MENARTHWNCHENTGIATNFNCYMSSHFTSILFKLCTIGQALGYFSRLKTKGEDICGEGRVAAFAACRRFAGRLAARDASERSYAT